MRSLIVVALLAGCSSGGTAPSTLPDAGTLADAHLEATPGGPGTTCNTACDCQPGLGCVNSLCTQVTSPQYCCQSPTCPSGSSCQSASGTYARCGTSSSTSGGTTSGTNTGGSTGGTTTSGLPGGLIGGLSGGGFPGFDTDGGLGGFTTGGGGIDTDGGLGGITGGTSGGTQCATTPCQKDSDCTAAGCAKCNVLFAGWGNCQ